MQEIAVALALGLALACVFGGTLIIVVWLQGCEEPPKRGPTAADILERKEKRK